MWSLLLPPFLSILCFPLSLTLSSSLSPHSFLPPPSICLPFLPPFFLLTIEELPPGVTGPISPRGPDSVLHSPHPSPRLPLHPHHTLCCHSPPGSRPHNPAETIQRTQHLRSERGSSITSIQEDKNIYFEDFRVLNIQLSPWAKKHIILCCRCARSERCAMSCMLVTRCSILL